MESALIPAFGLVSALLLLLLGWIKLDTGDTRKVAREARDLGVSNRACLDDHERVLARHERIIYKRCLNGAAGRDVEDMP